MIQCIKSYRVGASAKGRPITRNGNTRNRYVFFRNKLMGAVVFRKIPYSNTSTFVAADNLALVWMNDYVVYSRAMRVASLNCATSSLPYFDSPILRTCNHPFALTVKLNTGYISCMPLKGKKRIWVGGFDIVELYRMVPSSCKKTLVG